MPDTERLQALHGKAAIVTGSSRGIGRAIALELANSGAAVVINARTSEDEATEVAREIVSRGGRAIVYMADVTKQHGAESLVEATVAAFKRVDVMVCNVGARLDCAFNDTSYDSFRSILEGTVGTSFLCAQASLAALIKSQGGSIVMIGGIGGHVGTTGRSAVSAGKAAVSGLARALAMELGPHRITVNCIAPGLINTESRTSIPEHLGKANPLNRPGTPYEIAAMVRMLCEPGGRYVTGQTIHVNGGLVMSGG